MFYYGNMGICVSKYSIVTIFLGRDSQATHEVSKNFIKAVCIWIRTHQCEKLKKSKRKNC